MPRASPPGNAQRKKCVNALVSGWRRSVRSSRRATEGGRVRREKQTPNYRSLLPFTPGQARNGEFVQKARATPPPRRDAGARDGGEDRRQAGSTAAGSSRARAASRSHSPPSISWPVNTAMPACHPDAGREFDVADRCRPRGRLRDARGRRVHLRCPDASRRPGRPVGPGKPSHGRLFPQFLGGEPACAEAERLDCLSRYYYTHDIFLESDTTIAVLSDTPSAERLERPAQVRGDEAHPRHHQPAVARRHVASACTASSYQTLARPRGALERMQARAKR